MASEVSGTGDGGKMTILSIAEGVLQQEHACTPAEAIPFTDLAVSVAKHFPEKPGHVVSRELRKIVLAGEGTIRSLPDGKVYLA